MYEGINQRIILNHSQSGQYRKPNVIILNKKNTYQADLSELGFEDFLINLNFRIPGKLLVKLLKA